MFQRRFIQDFLKYLESVGLDDNEKTNELNMFIGRKVYQIAKILIELLVKINEDLLIGIIILSVTVVCVIMFFLHMNDPVYPYNLDL